MCIRDRASLHKSSHTDSTTACTCRWRFIMANGMVMVTIANRNKGSTTDASTVILPLRQREMNGNFLFPQCFLLFKRGIRTWRVAICLYFLTFPNFSINCVKKDIAIHLPVSFVFSYLNRPSETLPASDIRVPRFPSCFPQRAAQRLSLIHL